MNAGREIGAARPRREDVALLRGEATYTDDLRRAGGLHMAVHRSRYGHARIEDVDTAAAEAVDGVVAVYTAVDVEESGAPGVIAPTSTASSLYGVDAADVPARARTPLDQPERPFLARDRARYVGEPIAVVLAEDRYVAHDAVDLIEVTYDRLDAVTHPREAVDGDAPQVHEDVPGNVAFDWEVGDAAAVDDAFEDATHTVSVDIAQQRVAPTSLEPRTALAEFDPETERLTVHLGTQGPHRFRILLSECLGLPEERIRVVAPEVGGGFGAKSKFYTDEPLAGWCALQTRRPVKWQATRSESFLTDIHGRGRTVHGELAFDDGGEVLGLRVESHANLGAYVSRGAPGTRTGSFVDVLSGQYAIPSIHCRVVGCLTNTVPVDSYRGSSRPMTLLTVERLMHLAARALDLDPAEFRRRNFVLPDAFPYETPVGQVYDSGEYAAAMDLALDMVEYDDLRERQAALRAEDRYLGIGICGVMDNAGTGSAESGRICIASDGSVTAYVGTADQGQGHRTTFAQLVADLLGVPFDDVEVREGDTDDVPTGGGASGSRSVVCGGEALRAASETLIEQAKEVAAGRLETAAEDLEFAGGEFHVTGASERSIGIQEAARIATGEQDRAVAVDSSSRDGEREREPGPVVALEATETRTSPATFPFGTHVAVVEVDTGTGAVELVRYVAVDDAGVQLNPTLVRGQIVGGVVQGIGQALFENSVYDEAGTLTNGSLQDYALPRAEHVPDVETGHTVTPSPYNELGVKGAGESGAAGAPAAVANAVADALSPFGIEHLDLPITPETVWRAVKDADRT